MMVADKRVDVRRGVDVLYRASYLMCICTSRLPPYLTILKLEYSRGDKVGAARVCTAHQQHRVHVAAHEVISLLAPVVWYQ